MFGHSPTVSQHLLSARPQIQQIFNGDFQIVEFGSENAILWFASRVGFLLRVKDFPDCYEQDQYQFDQKIFTLKQVL